MTIYYDPTEGRQGTRLPQQLVQSGIPLKGLEAFTGGDLLITPLDKPKMVEITESKPSQIALRKHTEAGLLIQRKTGRDLTNSIIDGHLTKLVIAKMLMWSTAPWLAFIGDIKCDRDGMCVIDGGVTNLSYDQVQGALEAWQLRGGYYSCIGTDALFTKWVNRWHTKVQTWREDVALPPRQAQQVITGLLYDPIPWRATLATMPNIGNEKASKIAEYCGSLWASLHFLTTQDSLKCAGKPKNVIGRGTINEIRGWLGLPDGTTLIPVTDEDVDNGAVQSHYRAKEQEEQDNGDD